MEGKLVKTGNDYILYSKDKTVLGITSGTMEGRMLSLKNCQAIENGYDLDELFDEVDESIDYQEFDFSSFKLGFKKALEILGGKKFSEEDMKKAIHFGASWREQLFNGTTKTSELFESLQQTEWDVEIVMDICGDKVYAVPEPALDENGCLILRRI